MTKEQAIMMANDYVRQRLIDVGPIIDVQYFDLKRLDELANDCDPDMIDIHRRVRSKFRNHWVVTYKIIVPPGQVRCPGTRAVSVFDDGEVSHC